MTLGHYVWIYGLAEALGLISILAIVLGVKWWRLRKERQAWRGLGERVEALIEAEIKRARDMKTTRPELRDTRIASLRALSKPFRLERFSEEESWQEVVGTIGRCFEGLVHTTTNTLAQPHPKSEPPSASTQEAGLAASAMDSDVDQLLWQYQQGRSALSSHQSSDTDLKQRYQELKQVNEDLLARIEHLGQGGEVDMLALRQELDLFIQSNLAFMQAAHNAERNLRFLEQQFEDLEGRIHNLQVTINNYRKSVHKLIGERDLLIEEKQQYQSQLDIKEKVIARLNRNYETLRREYTKIYGGRL